MGRIGYPEDVGEFVVFLASRAAEYISGQTLFIDGGVFSKPHWPYEV
jgi:NAD(P)-dependent dehydrogenase (short-subunit alcohol dehydrogenase family)